MSESTGHALIGSDLSITGDVRNGGSIEIRGLVEGSVSAEHVVVHEGGRIHGALVASSADIDGLVHGQILVRQLLQIGSTGTVRGDVRYGSIAVQSGAELIADMRNVPPSIAGDLNVVVTRGQSVRITTEDLTAVDPDSPAGSLAFAVSRPRNGFVARASAADTPIDRFTQTDLETSSIVFRHDGTGGQEASFDVTVTDHAGASSGPAKTVHVAVFDEVPQSPSQAPMPLLMKSRL